MTKNASGCGKTPFSKVHRLVMNFPKVPNFFFQNRCGKNLKSSKVHERLKGVCSCGETPFCKVHGQVHGSSRSKNRSKMNEKSKVHGQVHGLVHGLVHGSSRSSSRNCSWEQLGDHWRGWYTRQYSEVRARNA